MEGLSSSSKPSPVQRFKKIWTYTNGENFSSLRLHYRVPINACSWQNIDASTSSIPLWGPGIPIYYLSNPSNWFRGSKAEIWCPNQFHFRTSPFCQNTKTKCDIVHIWALNIESWFVDVQCIPWYIEHAKLLICHQL